VHPIYCFVHQLYTLISANRSKKTAFQSVSTKAIV
jgi:hypothetical protein